MVRIKNVYSANFEVTNIALPNFHTKIFFIVVGVFVEMTF